MSENEKVIQSETVEKPSFWARFGAGLKEWFRKLIVKLKHKTHMIPLVILIITSILYLCFLSSFSIVVDRNRGISLSGLSVFVNTLISVLILMVFLNAFPKRKKVNKVMLILVFVLLAVMIGFDLIFYINVIDFAARAGGGDASIYLSIATYIPPALNCLIVHIVFVGITIIALATMPLYKKALNKINTRKVVESTQMKESIDTSEE